MEALRYTVSHLVPSQPCNWSYYTPLQTRKLPWTHEGGEDTAGSGEGQDPTLAADQARFSAKGPCGFRLHWLSGQNWGHYAGTYITGDKTDFHSLFIGQSQMCNINQVNVFAVQVC